MLESSHRIRRSQRALPRQTASPHSQPAPQQRQGGQYKPAPSSRSGLQRLLARLLSSEAGASRRSDSRRERLRQRRSGAEPSRHKPAVQIEHTKQVIPLEAVRPEATGGRPGGTGRGTGKRSGEPPAPRIRRTAKSQRDRRSDALASAKHRGKPAHPPIASKPRRSFSMSAFTQGMRLVILGVGVWAIIGTALSVWDPSTRSAQVSQAAADGVAQAESQVDPPSPTNLSHLHLGQEMSALGTRVAPLTQAMSDLVPGVFVMDLDSGDYFSLNGEAAFPAASMIKVPILVAFFQDVDAGKIPLNEVLTLQQPDLASGSGEMQYAGVGTQYSALETATNMIINSDNTATNMIIHRLGGIEALNQRFQEWGLQQTVLHNLLPDLEGTNTLSPKELSTLVARVSEGELVSLKSRDRLFGIMERTVNNSLLPSALGEGATIAHKTGDIGSLAGDTGLVDIPNGKRYAISVMAKRPHNDARAYELVVQIGGAVYEYLSQAATSSPAMTGSPASYPVVPTPAVSPAAGSGSSSGASNGSGR